MSNRIIGCGKWNPSFLYIFYCIIIKCLNEILTYIFSNIEYNVPDDDKSFPELNRHVIIKDIFKYIFYVIFSFILIYFRKKSNSEKSLNERNQSGTNLLLGGDSDIKKESNETKELQFNSIKYSYK